MVLPFETGTHKETGEKLYRNPETGGWEPFVTGTLKDNPDQRVYKTAQGWAPIPEADASFIKNFIAGSKSTANLMYQGTDALLKDAIGDVGEMFGFEDNMFKKSAEKAIKKYALNESAIRSQYPKYFDNFQDIENMNDVLQYVQEGLGRGLPSLMTMVVAGGLGRAVGKGLHHAAAEQVKTAAANKMMKSAVLVAGAAQNIPESHVNLRLQGVDSALSSVIVGSMKTGLDSLPATQMLQRMYGGPVANKITNRALQKAFNKMGVTATTAMSEGVTEAGQEALDAAAESFLIENREFFTEENLVRTLDAGFQGFLVGGTGGAITSTVNPNMNILPYRVSDEELEKRMQEIQAQEGEEVISPAAIAMSAAAQDSLNRRRDFARNELVGRELKKIEEMKALAMEADKPMSDVYDQEQSSLPQEEVSFEERERTTTGVIVPKSVEDFLAVDDKVFTKAEKKYLRKVIKDQTLVRPTTKVYKKLADNNLIPTELTRKERALVPPNRDIQKISMDIKNRGRKRKSRMRKLRESALSMDYLKQRIAREAPASANLNDWMSFMKDRTFVQKPKDIEVLMKPLAKDNTLIKKEDVLKAVEERAAKMPILDVQTLQDEKLLRKAVTNYTKGPMAIKKGHIITPKKPVEVSTLQDMTKDVEVFSDNPDSQAMKPEVLGSGLAKNLQVSEGNQLGTVSSENTNTIFKDVQKVDRSLETTQTYKEREQHVIDTALRWKKAKTAQEKENMKDSLQVFFYEYISSDHVSEDTREALSKEAPNLANAYKKVEKALDPNDIDRSTVWLPSLVFSEVASGRMNLSDVKEGLSKTKETYKKALDLLENTGNVVKATIPKAERVSELYDGLSDTDIHAYELSVMNNVGLKGATQQYEENVGVMVEEGLSFYQDKSSPLYTDKGSNIFKDVLVWVKTNITGPMHVAQSDAGFAKIEAQTRAENATMQALLQENLGDLLQLQSDRPVNFHLIMDMMANMRESGLKAVKDDKGYHYFVDKDGVAHYTNPDLASTKTKQQFYEDFNKVTQVFDRHLDHIQEQILDIFKTENIDFTKEIGELGKQVKAVKDVIALQKSSAPTEYQAILKDRADAIDDAYKAFKILQQVRDSYYVPFMRFGDRIISVFDKDNELVYSSFVEESKFSGKMNKYQVDLIQKEIKERGFDGEGYTIKGLKDGEVKRVTYPENKQAAEKAAQEGFDIGLYGYSLLQGVLSSGSKEQYNSMANSYEKAFKGKALQGFLGKSKNIPGYSTDWGRVINAWGHSSAVFLARLKHAPDRAKTKAFIDNVMSQHSHPSIHKYAEEHWEYVSSFKSDMPKFRQWNFTLAMGWNPSTALLQLLNGPMSVVPWVLQFSGNPISENAKLAKVYMDVASIVKSIDFKTGEIRELKTKTFHNKIKDKYGQEVADLVQVMIRDGHIEALFTLDHADNVRGETRTPVGKLRGITERVLKNSGAFISTGEQLSRIGNVIYLADKIVKNQEALSKARIVLSSDARYQALREAIPEYTEKQHMVLHALDTTHGVFGKAGRGRLQRGAWGSMITPFMTHPQAQIAFLGRMLKGKSLQEKLAGAYMLSTYMAVGGFMALPAMELVAAFYELFVRAVFGQEDDFEKKMREFLADKTSPTASMILSRGIPRGMENNPFTLSRTAIGNRVTLALPFQQPLIALSNYLKGQEGALADMMGPTVGYVGNMADYVNSGGKAKNLMPVALKNAYKGLIDYGLLEDLTGIPGSQLGATTVRGTPLATPDELSFMDKFWQTVGVRPALVQDRQELKYYERLAGTFFRPEYDRIRKSIAEENLRYLRARKRGDYGEAKVIQNNMKRMYQDLFEYVRANKVPLDNTRVNAIFRSQREKLISMLYPGWSPAPTKMGRAAQKELRSIFEYGEF